MLERPVITLTTDFGLRDPFVGIMKGIILGINPKAKVVDLSHGISPYNIIEASHVISMSHKNFPVPSIHIVIVDPGVGGLRRPLLVITEDHYFIGPDNGVFTAIFGEHGSRSLFKVIHISASHYFHSETGPTFHGRDIFAPSAAWLSKGVESAKFGEEINDYVTIPVPKIISRGENAFEGKVIYIDGFGNAITNLTNKGLNEPDRNRLQVVYNNSRLNLLNYYAEQESPGLSAIINSFGSLELFSYKENASVKFGIKVGDKVSVTLL